jgi:hypothetical protein
MPYQVQGVAPYRQKDMFFSAVVTSEIAAVIIGLLYFQVWEVVSIHLAVIFNLVL